MLSAVDKGDYQEANQLYYENVLGNYNSESAIYIGIKERINNAYNNYNAGKCTFDEANTVLQRIDKCNIFDTQIIQEIASMLNALAASKNSYELAEEYMSKSNYLDAIMQFGYVIENDVNYEEARNGLARAKTNYELMIGQEAQTARLNGNYREAYQIISDAIFALGRNVGPGLESDYKQIKDAYIQHTIATAAEQINDTKNYSDALRTMTWVFQEIGGDALLRAEIEKQTDSYVQYTIALAAEQFGDNKNYSDAIRTINLVVAEIGENASLMAELEKYYEYFPVILATLDYDVKGQCIDIGTNRHSDCEIEKDVLGNRYTPDYVYFPKHGSALNDIATTENLGRVEYFLNSKYSTLTGILYLPYISRAVESPRVPSMFKVYGDGTLLYEAPMFRRGVTDPIQINVDITGVRILKIVMLGVWIPDGLFSHPEPMVCAADLTVSK